MTYLFLHSRVDHHIAALHALWSALHTSVRALRYDDLDLVRLLRGHALPHQLLDLGRLRAFRHVRSLDDTLGLLHRLVQLLHGLHLLARFCFSYLLDRTGVEGAQLRSEGRDRFLRDREVGLVVFGLVVEEPCRQAVFRVQRVSIEAFVDKVCTRLLSID